MPLKDLTVLSRELAKLLRREREARDLSLSTVAERAGLSYQMVSYVERDMRLPTVETMVRIAWAIGVDPAEILKQAVTAMENRTT